MKQKNFSEILLNLLIQRAIRLISSHLLVLRITIVSSNFVLMLKLVFLRNDLLWITPNLFQAETDCLISMISYSRSLLNNFN